MSESGAVIAALREHALTVAVAESLTGGALLSTLIQTPGASAVVRGGVVAYDTGVKSGLLGVDSQLLATRGPVDPEVARQMARGVLGATRTDAGRADIGIATTGVAGPDPDPQTGTAVGTVFLGISSGAGTRSIALNFAGDREQIRGATVAAALREILIETKNIAQIGQR